MNSASVWAYFLQALPISLIAGLIYVVIRIEIIKRRKLTIRWADEFNKLLFICYLTGLISLVILPENFWLHVYDGIFLGWWDEILPIFSFGGFNLVPTVIKALSGELIIGSWVKTMLIGNIAMFLPFGFFLLFVTEKVNKRNIFAAAIVVPFIAELLQMVFGRSFDVDDLICNFIGIVIGFFIAYMLKTHRFCSQRLKQKNALRNNRKENIMKKWIKILIIVLAVVLVLVIVFLWIHRFEITRFIPRRGYA